MINDSRLRRHELGFLQVRDPPTADELREYYSEKYYQQSRGNYRASYSDAERAYLDVKLAQRVHEVTRLRGDSPGRFLDVGCGEGFAMAWLSLRGWSVEGIDYNNAGITAMNPDLGDKAAFGDVFELLGDRVASGLRYQLVWLSNVLEHVLDPVALMQSLRLLVAEDGVLVVTVPNDGSPLQESLLENGDIPERFWIAIPDHLSYFSAESLRRLGAHTGWRCRKILADFPIDVFLLHPGSNYAVERGQGEAAHRARVRLELLLGEAGHDRVNAFYAAMAAVGLGRQLTAFLTPVASS